MCLVTGERARDSSSEAITPPSRNIERAFICCGRNHDHNATINRGDTTTLAPTFKDLLHKNRDLAYTKIYAVMPHRKQ